MQPDALLQQLQRPAPGPAGPEGDPGQPPAGPAGGVAVVDRLLEQRHPGLLPEPVAEEGGGVAGHGQDRADGQLGGVEVVGEPVRVDPQVHLERGVGALEADVVGGQLQRVGPVDPDPERLLAQPSQPVVEGPVAGGVRQRGQLEVLGFEGGQDPHHHHLAAVPGGGPAHDPQGLVELAGHGREGPAGQRRRGQVQLQVEPVDLQHHPGVGRLGPDRLVAGQGAALAVDQAQLQLGPDGGRAGPEARPLQQPLQRLQAFLESQLEALVVHRVEAFAVDRQAHGGSTLPSGGRARTPRTARLWGDHRP